MLSLYFQLPATQERHRAGAFAGHMDDYASFLSDHRYCACAARRHLRTASAFSRWVSDTDQPMAEITDGTEAAFAKVLPTSDYIGHGRKHFGRVKGHLATFVGWMRDTERLNAPSDSTAALPSAISDFEAWMLQHRRIQMKSMIGSYRPILTSFLATVEKVPDGYVAANVRAFITNEANRLSRKRLQTYALVVRMFLRFQATRNVCSPDLIGAVPKIAQWRKDQLPKHISPHEVERIVRSCDLSTQVGRRNHAMLLLLARLGLRAGDVTGLRLSDIDWQRARLWVSGKGARREALPLPQDVGDAVLAYVTRDRPRTEFDDVFVTARAPYVALHMKSLSTVVVRAAARAGVTLPGAASHVFRHSLATALLADGVSLGAVGAVLRHRSPDTTAIYAKVDANLLRSVSRPWPVPADQ